MEPDALRGVLFQFQTGSIKSTILFLVLNNLIRFQFQTGSIKSLSQNQRRGGTQTFQFQTGSIKSLQQIVAVALRFSRFNSKLVRLKAPTIQGEAECDVWFQFQTGSIKSCRSTRRPSALETIVSIPNWFD